MYQAKGVDQIDPPVSTAAKLATEQIDQIDPVAPQQNEKLDQIDPAITRHMTESQRAMVAAKLANMERGEFAGNQHVVSANLPTAQVSRADAASMLNVSERSVNTAAKLAICAAKFCASLKANGLHSEWLMACLQCGQRARTKAQQIRKTNDSISPKSDEQNPLRTGSAIAVLLLATLLETKFI